MNLYIPLLLIASLSCFRHDFHVTITHGEVNPKTETLQVYMKVFTDDLEDCIAASTKRQLKLARPDVNPKADSIITHYILSHFSVKTNEQKLNFRYIGKEIEQDIVFIYLEVPIKPTVKQLSVTNTLFFDTFDDQSNIVNMEVRGEVESAFLNKNNPNRTLYFK